MTENEFSSELISAELETRFIGKRVLYLPVTTSTMDVARAAAISGAPQGTVVITDEQTAGRGRLKRTWLTPRGSSIAMSVILYPDVRHLPYLIMVTSLAVAKGIEKVSRLKPQIKWPNDILINGKKASGILIENGMRGSTVAYAVIGIGVNVNLSIAGIPELRDTATSLSDEVGHPVPRLSLVRHLLKEMEERYLALTRENTVFEEWRDSLVTLGKNVRAVTSDAIYEGVADSVSPDGSLLIRTRDGEVVRVVAGDVTLGV